MVVHNLYNMKRKKKMKYLTVILAAVLFGCATHYSIPAGHKPCKSNNDCHNDTYCGFTNVDTYAVCRH
jgi:hypothetical protein